MKNQEARVVGPLFLKGSDARRSCLGTKKPPTRATVVAAILVPSVAVNQATLFPNLNRSKCSRTLISGSSQVGDLLKT